MKRTMTAGTFAGILAATAFMLPSLAAAQPANYPNRPIRVVIGFAAGGSTDIIVRAIGARMSQILKQQVIVENRPGADSLIATQHVAQADPDGYTLLAVSGSHTINASMYPNVKVDPVKDFAPVAMVGDAPNYIVVNPTKVPVNTLEELIAYAKKNPGKLNYASSATTTFLATELFASMAGIKMQQISYKGAGAAVPALLGGEVDLAVTAILNVQPHVKAGKLRALATTGARRSPLAPDVPTATEKALPGYTSSTWYGYYAPAKTPRDIVQFLNTTIYQVMAEPGVKATLDNLAVDVVKMTPDEFLKFTQQDVVTWAKVVKDTGAAQK